jgi:hypothetical protein
MRIALAIVREAALEGFVGLGRGNGLTAGKAVAVMLALGRVGPSEQCSVPEHHIVEIVFGDDVELDRSAQVALGLRHEHAPLRREAIGLLLIVEAFANIGLDVRLTELDEDPIGVERKEGLRQIIEIEGPRVLDCRNFVGEFRGLCLL